MICVYMHLCVHFCVQDSFKIIAYACMRLHARLLASIRLCIAVAYKKHVPGLHSNADSETGVWEIFCFCMCVRLCVCVSVRARAWRLRLTSLILIGRCGSGSSGGCSTSAGLLHNFTQNEGMSFTLPFGFVYAKTSLRKVKRAPGGDTSILQSSR